MPGGTLPRARTPPEPRRRSRRPPLRLRFAEPRHAPLPERRPARPRSERRRLLRLAEREPCGARRPQLGPREEKQQPQLERPDVKQPRLEPHKLLRQATATRTTAAVSTRMPTTTTARESPATALSTPGSSK